MKTTIFIAPPKYVQGAGAIFDLGTHVKKLGCKNALVVGGKRGLDATRLGRETSFNANNIAYREELFGGETTDDEIARLTEIAHSGFAAVIACGGGKTIDAVKAAASLADVKCVVAPTVASNDSPCSSLSVIYNADGTMNRVQFHGRSPDLVLVDTQIIADAPVEQLVSGMGDALATFYEAEAGFLRGVTNLAGGAITQAALALARLCRDTLYEFGVGAVIACENNVVTPALERVVEANTLLSGLGFESGALYLAHALSEGLHLVPGTRSTPHGDLVAYGLLAQLVYDAQPHDVFARAYEFCKTVGLPVKLSGIGAEPGELLREACRFAVRDGSPGQGADADALYAAVVSVNGI